MNPLTLVKRIQKINSKEAALGISDEASWHAKYKDSAYVFVGGIPFDLTEGDLLAVFSQYGEIVDVNLVRDKGTGKSKGFAFIAYEDQRSTNLAVDNLNGAQVLGRVLRVDHVSNYKKKEEEDEELEKQKREARGVCRAFQKGECTRGAGCKFSHDEQRAANTGWGAEDKESRWGHNKFPGPSKSEKTNRMPEPFVPKGSRPGNEDAKHSREKGTESRYRDEPNTRDEDGKLLEKRRLEQKDNEMNRKEERDRREDHYSRDDKRSRRYDESEMYVREDRDRSRGYKRSTRDDDYSTQHRQDRYDDHQRHKPHR